ncbi:GTP-binding protein [Clostridium sp.]|uniref:GTP-binding protein n=1 Tax=Clostridium sp. TaxID=1506 RepID=UPI003F33DA42
MKSKLEIVTGFLGAGKTAFINSYLKTEGCNDEKILIIQLEEGNREIEGSLDLIKVIKLKEITEVKNLLKNNLSKESYDRVIIEFNGTLKLEDIRDLLVDNEVKKLVRFYGSYYIGEGENLKLYIVNMGEILIPFIQGSKLLIVNNFDILDNKKKEELRKLLEEVNLTSPIIYSKNIGVLERELRESKYFKRGLLDKITLKYIRGNREK